MIFITLKSKNRLEDRREKYLTAVFLYDKTTTMGACQETREVRCAVYHAMHEWRFTDPILIGGAN